MCRAVRVLCAASDSDRLRELRAAAVSAHWELVGGASSLTELEDHAREWRPDIVVVDGALGDQAVPAVRRSAPNARIVTVGSLPGSDAECGSLDEIRPTVLGLPRPGGPVRA
jgi:hypothetical protein